jgi:hypothetical protein
MSASAGAAASAELAWYVYGVVEGAAATRAPTSGVEGDVAVLREGDLAALVSRVPLTEYGDEPVRARLEDPAWLEEKARAHEAVLAAMLGSGAVLPFRFLTLYRDEAELREFLRSREDELRTVLERIRGKIELGVKAFVDMERLRAALARENPILRELDTALEEAAPGKAYLLRRRREQALDEQVARFRFECAQTCHARLSAASEAAVSNPPQPRELSGRTGEMVLNGAYLVPTGDERLPAAVSALAEEYGPSGIELELTGPWPPYNFVPREVESG